MPTPRLSFEFFPPRSELQSRRFWRAFGALETLQPDYVSITWGAQGSDSEASLDLLKALKSETQTPVVAHLTCAGQRSEQLHATLDTLESMGITRVLALRGDHVPSAEAPGTLRYATELVELLQQRGGFEVTVSAYPEVHPEAESAAKDLDWLCRKAQLGATRAITQFFFEPEPFLRLRDALNDRGHAMPLVPGILPVHDIAGIVSFAGKCGSSVPDRLRARFENEADAAARDEIAVDEAFGLCSRLMAEGVDELHLYTLNRAHLSQELAQRLGVNREKLRGSRRAGSSGDLHSAA